MAGDTLARGGKTATFGMPKVSQQRWDEIFGRKSTKKKPEVKREK